MLSKTAEYALRAAVCLAQGSRPTQSANVLATLTKVPRRYLHKVVQDLVTAGLVRSQPGPGGGYTLAKPADEVSILDVVNAVAPIERITHCPLGLTSHTSLCPLHRQLDDVYAATQEALGKVSLAQVVQSSSKIVPLCEVSVAGSLAEMTSKTVKKTTKKTTKPTKKKSTRSK